MKKPKSLMLAAKAPTDLGALRYPMLISPKLDGVRAYVRDGVVYSRTHKPIPCATVQREFGSLCNGLDGELIVGAPTAANTYNRTVSAVMADAQLLRGERVVFHVFDWIPDDADERWDYIDRLRYVRELCRKNSRTVAVPHYTVLSAASVQRFEEQFVTQGYEGAMLRDPAAAYKFGRSTTREQGLLKLKRFQDGEAIVYDVEELRRNTNARGADGKRTSHKSGRKAAGVLGALHVRDVRTGVEFAIGSGFTDSVREILWAARGSLIGAVVKYRFQPAGVKIAPRFPTFVGFRDRRDM